jgi:superfamily II DNA or RNA helicase
MTSTVDGHLALWHRPGGPNGSGQAGDPTGDAWAPPGQAIEPVRLALPTKSGSIRSRSVDASIVSLSDAVEPLLDLAFDAPASPSVHAAAAVVRLVVGAIAEGRVVPTAPRSANGPEEGGSGSATSWRVAPWTEDETTDLARIIQLAPPELCCEVVGTGPLTVRTPTEVIHRLASDIATAVVATSASLSRSEPPTAATVADIEATIVGTGPVLVMIVEVDEADGSATVRLELRNRTDHTQRMSVTQLWADPVAAAGIGAAEPDRWLIDQLRALAVVWAPTARLLDERVPDRLTLAPPELVDLILEGLPRLAAAGVEVHLPRGLVKAIDVAATVSRSSDSGEGSGAFALDAICEVRLGASVDGVPLTEDEIARLALSHQEVVWLRNSFVQVDPRLAGRLQRRLSLGEAIGTALGGSITVDGVATEVHADLGLAGVIEAVRAAAEPCSVTAVDGVEAVFRPYQQRGIGWLQQTTEVLGGAILADDMGLGKTLQIIALHVLSHSAPRAASGPTLVVGPASLIVNWEREVARFAPRVPVRRFHGPGRHLDDLEPEEIVVTTYGTLRADADRLAEVRWGLVVADEAQHVKNHLSLAAQALRHLSAGRRVAVTGTPVENRLADLWSLMDWALPGLLGSITSFRQTFARPIERDGDPDTAAQLTRVVAPFVLRRTKADPSIVPDLPPRLELDHPVSMSPEQLGLYKAFTDEVLEAITDSEGIARRGLVLKLLGGLKQICDHPALFLHQDGPVARRSGKLDVLDELLDEIVAADDAVLIFTQYVEMGDLLVSHLDSLGVANQFLHGQTSVKRRQEMVDRFQAPHGPPVFVISIKAGGTGLNLTRANHVVHFDRWWNPAVENQASDRAWRIGQDQTVMVHRLTTVGSLEERIAAELGRKKALAEAVVGTGESWLTELNDDDLRALVDLGGG